ncbi:hypothetical protein GCM10009090_15380 [[Pseudomonas] boreopolis]|uniref:Aldo/keto reductase n=1 Tax=Xanthomonas boreopolis TaxID=86183 RepID=A0A919KHT2_9XANT|nr:hypothetical protein GCM10009090_15380 [[Pseudomonas] boreopolis]
MRYQAVGGRTFGRMPGSDAGRPHEYIVPMRTRIFGRTGRSVGKSALEGSIDRSLRNLEADTLDLVQLHCPPTDL